MDNSTLKQLQTVELSILEAFDDFCRKWNIKYSIYAGTMLGAIRHKGFIPWDDDVDVAMTRGEYTKFCDCIRKYPVEGYVFSNYETTAHSPICHGKFGKKGTLFLQQGDVEGLGHHEIWVDIFPLDKVPLKSDRNGQTIKIGRELVFLTRADDFRTNDTLKKKLIRRVITLIPKKVRRNRMFRDAERLRELDKTITSDYEWASMSTLRNIQAMRFPREMVENYSDIIFEGKRFMSFADCDGMLKIIYDDYMKLPPAEEQICKHNPVKIKFK